MKNIYSILLFLLTGINLTYGQSPAFKLPPPAKGRWHLLAFDSTGSQLLASDGHITNIYKISGNDAHLIAVLKFPTASVNFSHSGKKAYLLQVPVLLKGKLYVYDTETWTRLKQTRLIAITGNISINANDSLLSFGSLGKIKTNDAQSLRPNKVFWERQSERIIIFDPVHPTVCATVTTKNTIQIIDLRNDSILRETKEHPVRIQSLSYRPDGTLTSIDKTGKQCVENNFSPYKEPTAEKSISPVFGYAPETGFTLGAGLIGIVQPADRLAYYRPSVYTGGVNYGFAGSQLLSVLSLNSYIQKRWDLIVNLEYDVHSRNFYFGIGENATTSSKQAYFSDNFWASGSLFRLLGDQIGIGLNYDIRHNTPAAFQEVMVKSPAGSGGGWLIGVGPIARWDNRDNILSPTRGHLLDVSFLRYGPGQAGDYWYNEAKIDYRKYFPLGPAAAGRQIAIQGMADLTWSGETPFYSLPYFTADRAFRGIYRNLYIDKQVAYAQTEFRSLFSVADPRFGYAIFAGVADGAADFFKGYTPAIKGIYGLGLRQQLFPKNSFLLRVDAALTTKGQFGCYAGMGVSF